MDVLYLRDTQKMPYPARTATRILVIDDDASVSAAIRAILTRHQCETVLASRAHAGIHAFQESGFDVVMVDLFMPGMNGLDTIARIRSESAVPIIACPAFGFGIRLILIRIISAWRYYAARQSLYPSHSRRCNWLQPSTKAAWRPRLERQGNDTDRKSGRSVEIDRGQRI